MRGAWWDVLVYPSNTIHPTFGWLLAGRGGVSGFKIGKFICGLDNRHFIFCLVLSANFLTRRKERR